MKKAVFTKGTYKNESVDDITSDLRQQGFNPQLIKEKPNASLAAHKHRESHILVQVEGAMTVTSGSEDFLMQPGDKLFIPPQVMHAARFSDQGSQRSEE